MPTLQRLVQPLSIRLRDGDLVLYRRSRSLRYQCRYRLSDGTWHRQSTGKASLEQAVARACDLHDEARYRERLGLVHRTHLFAHIAALTLAELRQQMDAGHGKTAYHSYASCIKRRTGRINILSPSRRKYGRVIPLATRKREVT